MDLNKKLEELKPYQLNCNVFDVYSYNGLSMQDLLCQFFTKINECITVSNETIDLAKWLVNEGLEKEVVKKLMIWIEDGTLENIINVNLFNTLNDKLNAFNTQLEDIVINVKNFGCKGDGITNDSDFIEKADNKNGVLFFPKGIYLSTYVPMSKCKGEGAILKINDYEINLCDTALPVNSKYQEFIRMNSTFIGLDSGLNNDNINAYGNVGLGHNTLKSNNSSVRNTAIGNNSQMNLVKGYSNTTVGVDTLHNSYYSDRNTMLGATAGKNIGNIKPNETNGLFNGVVDTTTNYDEFWNEWRSYAGNVGDCSFIANNSMETTSNVGVGRNALGFAQTPKRNVAIGYNALESGLNAENNVAIGECSLQFGIKSLNSVFIGCRAGYHNMDNNQDVVIGKSAMENTVHSNKNISIGYQSLVGTQSSNNNVVTSNIAIGRQSLANYNGDIQYNIGIGEQSLLNVKGNNNVGVGYGALAKTTVGSNNTAIGFNAGNRQGTETFNNTSSIGSNSFCNGDNQIQLGDSNTTTYCYGGVQSRSDARDKTDIEDTKLGLDFINMLRPVDFIYDYREDYNEYDLEGNLVKTHVKDGSKKRIRKHHGLIAQEVKEVIDTLGIDFGGYQDHKINGGNDVLSIGYNELIAPLIKSVQELTLRVEKLENN